MDEVVGIKDLASSDAGFYRCEYGGGVFDVYYKPKPGSRRLFVILAGARNLKKHKLPKIDRWSWANDFPGAVLSIADPTLNVRPESLQIGWYLGRNGEDWSKKIASLSSDLASQLGIRRDKIFFYGSSAGGFASIRASSMVDGSTAVAINPQLNVLKYYENYVIELLSAGYGGIAKEELSSDNKFDAVRCFLESRKSSFFYVQNIKDSFHVNKYLMPFLNCLKGLDEERSGRVVVSIYSDKNGHGPEPKSMLKEIVDASICLNKRCTLRADAKVKV